MFAEEAPQLHIELWAMWRSFVMPLQNSWRAVTRPAFLSSAEGHQRSILLKAEWKKGGGAFRRMRAWCLILFNKMI